MKALGYMLVFVAALAVALIATLPLRLALSFAPLADYGFSAERVSGSAWDGRAEGANLGKLELGDVHLRLDPLALASGVRRVRFEAGGRLSGRGAMAASSAGMGVEGFTGSLPFEALGLDLPITGRLRFIDFTATMGVDGCQAAGGEIATDALRASAMTLQWEGPELRGPARCAEDGAVQADMTGADGGSTVTAILRILTDGRFTLELRVAASDPALAAALQPAGFASGPEGFTRLEEGRLRDVVAP